MSKRRSEIQLTENLAGLAEEGNGEDGPANDLYSEDIKGTRKIFRIARKSNVPIPDDATPPPPASVNATGKKEIVEENTTTGVAKDIATGVAKDIATGVAKDIATGVAKDGTTSVAENTATGVAGDTTTGVAGDTATTGDCGATQCRNGATPASGSGVDKSEAKSAEGEPKSIFGDFFNRPYTNPFAEAAKLGSKGWFTSVSSTGGGSTACSVGEWSATAPATGQLEETASEVEPSMQPVKPSIFPGEDDDKELFIDNNVVLLKSVAAKVEVGSNTDESPPRFGFRRQGEGMLRVLEGSDDECRLVLRQKGTWTLLLNTPLRVSCKFENVKVSSGSALKFAGLDLKRMETARTPGDKPPIAAYIIKFGSDAQKTDFLQTVQTVKAGTSK